MLIATGRIRKDPLVLVSDVERSVQVEEVLVPDIRLERKVCRCAEQVVTLVQRGGSLLRLPVVVKLAVELKARAERAKVLELPFPSVLPENDRAAVGTRYRGP